ncbi:unnamed protein product [Nippostrongylus brasiliensis]|uniref:Gonadotropin-releasing hormone receptor (inferred by orthology to a human protein) n=1 Tax=Nippostrongylus brasiliensis TaxID=27835 RepID=A0A0N4Y2D1_NIPBR|nr:unnamed protein product [Nippostrongylus brasiliensis]
MVNCTNMPPPDLTVTSSIISIVLCYIIVFIIAFVGNFAMFLILCRNQWIKVRRVHSLLLQMNIAHLMFYLFKTATHPCYPSYTQCVSRNMVNEVSTGVVFYFSILNIVQVYFFPLFVTVVCYSLILWKISEESATKKKAEISSDALLRRSGVNNLERARSRTLRMTFIIVVAFICCWTPYAIMMFLHFLTKTDWIPKDVRKFIYAFAVFNSAISPYLYGYFSFDVKKELKLLLSCSRSPASDRHLSCSANTVR